MGTYCKILLIALTLQIQSGKCCALGGFLIELWSATLPMRVQQTAVYTTGAFGKGYTLLTITQLETHQVHSTSRFEFARSTQSAVIHLHTGKIQVPGVVTDYTSPLYLLHVGTSQLWQLND